VVRRKIPAAVPITTHHPLLTQRRNHMSRLLMVFFCCTVMACGDRDSQTSARIVLDGKFADWETVRAVAGDTVTTSTAAGLGRLWITNDEYSLLIRFEVAPESSIQENNDLELCLDTDDDVATGLSVHGIGAELCWRFGDLRGTFVSAAGETDIEHEQVGLIAAPTVTGTDFEIGLALDAEPAGVPLFPGGTVRLVLRDGRSGELIPAAPGGVEYLLRKPPAPLVPIDIGRHEVGHVRFLSYNLNNHLTDPERRASLRRVLNTIDADVILLQEIRDTPTDEAVAYVLAILERGDDIWYTVKVGGESTVVISSFPIQRVDSLGDSGGLVLRLGSGPQDLLLLIALSMPCCAEHERRAAEADLIASYLRDAKSGVGEFQVPEGTPIVMMGDANLVGLARDRRVLQYGDIVDTITHGPGALPDWDDTPLVDLVPRLTHRPQAFTWHGDDFPPGRLDYVFYSDATLGIGNRFVLHTPSVPQETLVEWNLAVEDTDVVTDHLPVVADVMVLRTVDSAQIR
jgi:endonuclease/exonuclease/phosphatase family metal-dependent hydrolase